MAGNIKKAKKERTSLKSDMIRSKGNKGTYYSGFISKEESGDWGFAGDRSGVGASPWISGESHARRNRKTASLASLGASFLLNQNRVETGQIR